ncbi:hypothetical protein GALL_528820 [mine drainage metagenome]|uniref:Uncharacterized protein n=1 Tax=mine drainage metagenome TaxID=410659 RepID=A0A1J5P330_9ZZZZ
MGVAADHDVDRAVEFFHNVDDGPGDAGAFIVVAGRKTAFVDQHDDGLDATRLQFGDQRVDGVGLVAEFKTRRADRRNDIGRALQGQADKGDRNPVKFPDLVGRKKSLAGILLDRGGRKVVEFRASERMRPLTCVDRVAAAILHP